MPAGAAMELEQFAYVASHDLQEPLRKVASFGELHSGGRAVTLPKSRRIPVLVRRVRFVPPPERERLSQR